MKRLSSAKLYLVICVCAVLGSVLACDMGAGGGSPVPQPNIDKVYILPDDLSGPFNLYDKPDSDTIIVKLKGSLDGKGYFSTSQIEELDHDYGSKPAEAVYLYVGVLKYDTSEQAFDKLLDGSPFDFAPFDSSQYSDYTPLSGVSGIGDHAAGSTAVDKNDPNHIWYFSGFRRSSIAVVMLVQGNGGPIDIDIPGVLKGLDAKAQAALQG